MPLVDVTGGEAEPNTLAMASDSALSLRGVEVPWALMWPIWSGVVAGVLHGQGHAGGGPGPAGNRRGDVVGVGRTGRAGDSP